MRVASCNPAYSMSQSQYRLMLQDWAAMRKTFPGARIVASTFDDWVDLLASSPAAMAALPVIDNELGDTWIHGAVSDPQASSYNVPLPVM